MNNLQVYQGRQEESTGYWGSVNAPHGEGKDQQSIQPGSSKVESVESGMVISGAKKKVVDVGANDDHPSEVVNMSGKHEYWSCLADMV